MKIANKVLVQVVRCEYVKTGAMLWYIDLESLATSRDIRSCLGKPVPGPHPLGE